MAGYNITCDGDLYTRKCYVNTASGKQEIIGYDSAGNPISKAPTTGAGTASNPTSPSSIGMVTPTNLQRSQSTVLHGRWNIRCRG